MSRIITTKPPPGAQVDWGNPINRGLIAWWLFNEGAGSRVTDIAGGNHGVLTNMDPANDWVGSLHGGALDFDGSDDYVTVGDPDVLDFGLKDFSLSAWIRTSDIGSESGTRRRIISSGFNTNGFEMIIDPGNGSIGVTVDNTFGHSDGVNLGDGIWHHVVVVANRASDAIFYVDGQLDGSPTDISAEVATNLSNSIDVDIGKRGQQSSGRFDGSINEVSVCGRAINAAEVQQLYHNSYGGILRRRLYFVPAAITAIGPPVSMQVM